MHRSQKKICAGVLAALTAGLVNQPWPALAGAALNRANLWQERPAASASPAAQAGPDFSAVAEELQRAVVSISVEAQASVSSRAPVPPPMHPFFERFFGQDPELRFRGQGQVPRRGQGSGFFIREDGLLLTNHHVVENAARIEVTMLMPDGGERTLEGEVVGVAPDYDVALVKTKTPANAKIAYLGSSDRVKVGEWVMAIGSPFGLSHSVSLGIVSAKGRREVRPSGRAGVYDFIQTDASINPGNSGGPLVNARGEVIGINSAINAAGQGIGFAVPIDLVKQMLPQLEKEGRFARGYLGVRIQPVSPELAKSFGLQRPQGALVSEVLPNSAAAKAGLRSGDIILRFGGETIHRASDLPVVASSAGAGAEVNLEIWRDAKLHTMRLTLNELDGKVAQATPQNGRGAEVGSLGLRLGDIDEALAQRLSLPSPEGAWVSDVRAGSPAARAGLREGDVVLRAAGTAITSAGQLIKVLGKHKKGDVVRLELWRESATLFAAIEIP